MSEWDEFNVENSFGREWSEDELFNNYLSKWNVV